MLTSDFFKKEKKFAICIIIEKIKYDSIKNTIKLIKLNYEK